MMKPRPVVLAALLSLWFAASMPVAAGPAAAVGDGPVVYLARDIITLDAQTPSATAVLVDGGRIIDVGEREAITQRAGAAVRIDERFADKVLVPGFVEPHIHPVLSALTLSTQVIAIEDWQLPGGNSPAARTPEEYTARLRQAARAGDAATPLVSWGYHDLFHGPLDRVRLDGISPTRAIIVWHRSAHEFIFNSAALAAAGIDAQAVAAASETVRSQIDLDGGRFWEQGAFDFLLPRILGLLAPGGSLQAGLQMTVQYLHQAGVTTSAEPGGVSGFYPPQIAVLGEETTPFRFYFIPDGRTLALQYRGEPLLAATEAVQQGARGHTAFLPRQVKLFADGAMFSQLMQMRDGYLDGHHGEWLMGEAQFRDAFRTYWDAGYQVHIHQNGDKGLDRVLAVLAENQRRNPRQDHRTTVVHFGFASPGQVRQLAELGAIVSANPYYPVILGEKYTLHGIGAERAAEMVRLADVVAKGIPLSLHSDLPMAPGKPLFLMWAAVNRQGVGGSVVGPGQRISAEQALRAVTLDAAYTIRLEGEVGSISPGKLANFTVLEENPLTVAPQRIKDIGIWGTVLEGRLQPL